MRHPGLALFIPAGLMCLVLSCGGGGGGGGTPPANAAPTWTSAAPTAAKEGHTYSYAMAGQDANADPLSFSLVSGPSGASLTGSTLTWVPTAAQAGSAQAFKARVSDGKGGSADQDWSVTPTANAVPAFTTTPSLSAKEGHAYAYTAGATDADGDTVTLAAISLPAGATFNGGVIAWLPSAAQVGVSQAFTVRATDAIGAQKDQAWTVTPAANAAPAFTSTPSPGAKEGHPYSYTAVTSDADGDTVVVTALSLPTGATFNSGVIAWSPSAAQAGILQTFTLRATDAIGAQTDQTWTVTPAANSNPAFSSSALATAKEGHPYSYIATATDADGDPVSLSSVTLPSGASFTNGALSWVPAPGQVGSAQAFTLRATDGSGGQTDQSWTVTPSANAAPAFTSTARTLAVVGTQYTYTPAATDADGDPVSMALISGPAGASLVSGTIQWIPVSGQDATPQDFLLRASDGNGKTTDQTWTVSVRASNAAPIISSTPATTLNSGTYAYTIVASDADGDALSYSLEAAPAGVALTGAGGNDISWLPTSAEKRVANAFMVRVTDVYGASATQSWSVSPDGTISGTRIINTVTDAGDVPKPDDISMWVAGSLAALVPDGSGGFNTINGSGLADGTFTIPNVPAGYYWFKSGTNYLWTNTSTMDLGYDKGGRMDAVLAGNASTQLAFTMTGLNAWQSGDDLQWTVSNNGYWNSLLTGATAAPVIGDAALTNMTVPWQGSLMADAAKGDQAYLTQLTGRTAGSVPYQAVANVFMPAPFTQVDGGLYTVTGGFASVPQTGTLRLNVARSQFSQFQPQVHPNVISFSTLVALDAIPGGTARGWFRRTPDLLTWASGLSYTDIDLGDLAFGNPFPPEWTPFLISDFAFRVNYLLPGTTTPAVVTPFARVVSEQLPSAVSPVRPVIGPVQAPLINGSNLQVDRSGVGLTPAISWTAPALGSPTGYMLNINRLYTSGTRTYQESAAVLRTKTTSITLPPGILEAGSSYYIEIIAISQPGVDFEAGPYRKRLPYAETPVLSGILTP